MISVRVLDQAQILLDVVVPFEQRLWIPFAERHGKEVPAIDVNGARQA